MDSFKPLVRFAGFEGEWEIERFGDIIEECFDKSTIENEDTLLSSSISGMYLNSELFGHQRGQSNIGYRKVRKNMLVLSAQNLHLGNANVNLRFDHGLVSPAYKIYDIIGANPEFMAHWIKREQTKDFFLNATTEGASLCRKNIIWEDLYGQYLSLPSLPEQQKISEYFTEIDRAISLQTEKLSKLKQIKAASLQNMFPQEGQMLPKVRFAGFEGEWERVRLGEIAQFFKGKGYSKNDLTEKGSPIFLYGMMYTKYRFAVNEVDTYTDKDFSSLLSQGNEVIIPASGETAEDIACASAFLIKDVILGGDLNVICFDLSLYSTPFIALSISNGSSRKYLSKCAQGKSVVHLRNSDIKTVVLSLPSLPEQQAIANYFTKLDRKIELETQKLEKLKQIKSACLSKMFV